MEFHIEFNYKSTNIYEFIEVVMLFLQDLPKPGRFDIIDELT